MTTKDGGQAFPQFDYGNRGAGMTLRDYFAGQAAGECFAQSLKRGFKTPQAIDEYTSKAAFWAYAMADAMIAERSK